MKKIFLCSMLLMAVASNGQVENGLAALQIGVGARPAAMGEAFTAVTDDAYSPFWNPAGAAALTARQVQVTHTEWFQDVQQDAASLLFASKRCVYGVHLLLNSVSGIEQRIDATEEPLSTFSAHDLVLGMTLAGRLSKNLRAGVNVRYVHERIYVESSSGFSLDAGVTYSTPVPGLQAGMSLQHFGSTSALKDENVRLPKTLRAGAAYRLPAAWIKFDWLIAADYVHIFDQLDAFHVGTEIRPISLLALRLGYQQGYDTRDISAGFGLRTGGFELDYAYMPFKQDLGNAHRFSFLAHF